MEECPSSENISREPHQMRITDHGKINLFVSFALKFLQENPQRPLVLHTLPLSKPANSSQKESKLASATATAPRLITVVEIVKREYGKWASARKTADGGFVDDSLRTGLHQYNELSCLEVLGLVDDAHEDVEGIDQQLAAALEGKNFLKQKFTAHLKVTLSVSALPELEEQGATYQPPTPPAKISKSAKARRRKQQAKREAAGLSVKD